MTHMKRMAAAFLLLLLGAAAAQSEADGADIYSKQCLACHGANGQGGAGVPLQNNSDLSDADFHIGIILHGAGIMPAFGNTLSDEEIAAVATYERTNWGNDYGELSAAQVAAVREGRSARSARDEPASTQEQAGAEAAEAPPAEPTAVSVSDGRLVDAGGMSLYLFLNDSLTGESTCFSPCTNRWLPLLAPGGVNAGDDVNADDLGTVDRGGGNEQVTFRGWPLYRSADDEEPGDTAGADISDHFLLVSADTDNISASMADSGEPASPADDDGNAKEDNMPTVELPELQPRVYEGDYAEVTAETLLDPDPGDWLMYKRTYDMQSYSPLDQITVDNISDLVPVWSFGTGMSDGHEAPPMVYGDLMFVTGPYSTLFVLDARSGDLIWQYKRRLPTDLEPEVCCGMVNRGVAFWGDKVYLATLDAHLLAFEATTGELVWDVPVEDYLLGYTMTLAPLVVDGTVIVGAAGGEYGVRGSVVAYDSETGEQLWKTWMTAGPGEPGNETWPGDTWKTGGASIWITGSYDPDLNLTYWGTSNAAPWMGSARPGDNLYVGSVVALDPQTGEIKAHYQYNPNESWDYDEVSDQTLVNITRDGEEVKGLIHAARNGNFYLLDRTDLGFVYAVPYIEAEPKTITGWEEDGRPIIPDEHIPDIGKAVEVCPSADGANNWFGLAFSPATGYAYVPTSEDCMTIEGLEIEYSAGSYFIGANTVQYKPEGAEWTGALQAIDVATGEVVWKYTQQMPNRSPVTATAGGLVFGGDIYDREFRAYDAETGDIVWRYKTNSSVIGVPMSYEIDGVQYIAVQAGYGGWAASMISRIAEQFGVPFNPVSGGAVWVFALKNGE